jgi:hypothetical protein
VAYDLEEDGFTGSRIHASQIRDEPGTLAGAVILEMIGYASHLPGTQGWPEAIGRGRRDVADFVAVCGNQQAARLMKTLVHSLAGAGGLPVEELVITNDAGGPACTRYSDHSSYWDLGLPAVMVSDTAFFRNPHYHRPTDTPDTLDYSYLAAVVCGLSAFLRSYDRALVVAGPPC